MHYGTMLRRALTTLTSVIMHIIILLHTITFIYDHKYITGLGCYLDITIYDHHI